MHQQPHQIDITDAVLPHQFGVTLFKRCQEAGRAVFLYQPRTRFVLAVCQADLMGGGVQTPREATGEGHGHGTAPLGDRWGVETIVGGHDKVEEPLLKLRVVSRDRQTLGDVIEDTLRKLLHLIVHGWARPSRCRDEGAPPKFSRLIIESKSSTYHLGRGMLCVPS